jgi:hypothetical protein
VQCCGALLCNGGTCSGAAAAAGIYEVCNGPCVAGTCISANTTVGGFVGTFCTAGCNPSNPVCPDDGSGLPAVCVPDNGSTTSGQCYAGCPGGVSSQCPYSETCASEGNGVYFCVP